MVWSLYGRFWCRSSLEALRHWRMGARACGQGPCDAASPPSHNAIHNGPHRAVQRPRAGAAADQIGARAVFPTGGAQPREPSRGRGRVPVGPCHSGSSGSGSKPDNPTREIVIFADARLKRVAAPISSARAGRGGSHVQSETGPKGQNQVGIQSVPAPTSCGTGSRRYRFSSSRPRRTAAHWE